jgi:hypothetical protein
MFESNLRSIKNNVLFVQKEELCYSMNYNIDFLDDILKLKRLSISKLVWSTLISKENSQQYYFSSYSRKDRRYSFSGDGDSSVIVKLKQYEWVPQEMADQLIFVKPTDADSKLLPDGFLFDNGWRWVSAVAFGNSIRKQEEARRLAEQKQTYEYQHAEEAAKRLGFDSCEEAKEMADLKSKDPEGFKKWRESNKESNLWGQVLNYQFYGQ